MGSVIGSLIFTSGARDQLHIYTGSTVTGAISGGTGGNNLMTLNGAGSDSMSGALTHFQTLIKQDSGTWTLTGTLGNDGGALPLAVEVQAGTLVPSIFPPAGRLPSMRRAARSTRRASPPRLLRASPALARSPRRGSARWC
jgi:hypothetical protein